MHITITGFWFIKCWSKQPCQLQDHSDKTLQFVHQHIAPFFIITLTNNNDIPSVLIRTFLDNCEGTDIIPTTTTTKRLFSAVPSLLDMMWSFGIHYRGGFNFSRVCVCNKWMCKVLLRHHHEKAWDLFGEWLILKNLCRLFLLRDNNVTMCTFRFKTQMYLFHSHFQKSITGPRSVLIFYWHF